MKSVDLQNIVKSKHQSGDGVTKIFKDLNGELSLSTIKRWVKMINETGSIKLRNSPGRPRTARTKDMIRKLKQRLNRKKRLSTRKLEKELCISDSSVHRILHDDLGCFPYKKITQSAITDVQKQKRIKFANWVFNHFKKVDIRKWLFSDEKIFDLDGMYNVQNDRVWAINRQKADKKGEMKKKHQFPTKVMVWLGVCSAGLTKLVILDKGTVNHERYIREVLPIALKCGNEMMGNDWMFQQDGASPHRHKETQQWCKDNFPAFLPYTRWPPNSPDLNPFDYSIWNELVKNMNWKYFSNIPFMIYCPFVQNDKLC